MRRTAIRLKTPARKLKQEIDLLVKAYVHARDGYRCLMCGQKKRLQAAHIFSKGKYQRLRFDPLNILSLCVGCHIYGPAHKDPVAFVDWINEKFPVRIEQLKVCAAVARKVDLQETLLYWQEQVDKDGSRD